MNSRFARTFRLPSLLLAAALQVMPLIRAALPAAETATNVFAIVCRWTAGLAAAFGGVNAVSGASTAITNPLNANATQGQPFTLRLTTAPQQAHAWTATPLPAGLTLLGTNGQSAWKIYGTPTVSGVFNITLTAKDQANSGPSLSVTATLLLDIASGLAPPAITTQPASLTATQGLSASFSVAATGAAPLHYQWRFQGTDLAGQTNAGLTLNPVTPNNAGPYTVVVTNLGGAITSSVATLTVVGSTPVRAPMSVTVRGAGSVVPDYNGQLLQIGASYTMTAVAASNSDFTGWTGSLTGPSPAVTFVMQSNLTLQANFAPHALVFVKGTYRGLFFETTGAAHESSGSLAVTTTASGGYSGSLTLTGKKYSLSGQFDAEARSTNTVSRGALAAVTVELELNRSDPDELRGRVTDSTWSSPLLANRGVFDKANRAAPPAGLYTLVLPGNPDAIASPGGDGFATVTVDAAGMLALKGMLADGTKLAQASAISKSGSWPFYLPLAGNSFIIGWLTFSNRVDDDLNGVLTWTRGPQPAGTFYPLGFTVETEAIGSRYQPPPPGVAALPWLTAHLWLSGGGLADSFTNEFTLTGRKINGGVKLAISSATGFFSGNAINPATGKPVSFAGALLQKRNLGCGFFRGPTASGAARIGP